MNCAPAGYGSFEDYLSRVKSCRRRTIRKSREKFEVGGLKVVRLLGGEGALRLLTDDVYGTFVHGFRSLLGELPHNTIGVYSYSKYFGCTGWRLGTIAIHEDNIFDKMIAKLPDNVVKALDKRPVQSRPKLPCRRRSLNCGCALKKLQVRMSESSGWIVTLRN